MTTAYLTHADYLSHTKRGHPEHAGRLERIEAVLDERGLKADLLLLDPLKATPEQVALVHRPEYVENLMLACERGGGMLDPDTYVLPASYEVALLAAGGAMRAVDAVVTGEAHNAFAALRPPGHHATPVRGMGFCLFNNIAIAARHAQAAHGLERVLIVDFDVHHGNGTQDAFYDDASVFFMSSHQYPFYPGTGALSDIGEGSGQGFTLNMPLEAGVGNVGFKALYEQLVWPLARRFKPQLVLVSAGFDAHWSDPLAMIELDLNGYAHLARELVSMADELCAGKIAFMLEGGYNLDALAYGVLNVLHALLGRGDSVDPLGPPGMAAEPSLDGRIANLKKLHGL